MIFGKDRYVCKASDRWRQVHTLQEARIAATLAREHCNDIETPSRTEHAAMVG